MIPTEVNFAELNMFRCNSYEHIYLTNDINIRKYLKTFIILVFLRCIILYAEVSNDLKLRILNLNF